jgi:hypothetical protein
LLQSLADDGRTTFHAEAGIDEAPLRSNALRAVERLRTLPGNGDRLHAIVARCDVGGELHKVVAAELGLSRRQFYRDLAFARDWISRDLATSRSREAVATVARDPRLQTALSLSAGGRGRAGADHFAPVVAGLRGEEAVWGHCLLAELLLDDGDVASARRELKVAFGLGGGTVAARARALVTRAKLLIETGRPSAAARTLERATVQLAGVALPDAALLADAESEARTLLAFCYHERGNFGLAARVHEQNPAAFPGVVSPTALRQYLNVNAMLACDDGDGVGSAQTACATFYQFAVSHGFLDDVSAALVQMAGIARFERRLDEAQRLAREALTIRQAIGLPDAQIRIMLTAVTLDRGEYAGAARLAREARALVATGSHAWWSTHLYEAEALARSGELQRALEICSYVGDEASNDDARITALRYRVEALAFDALGDSRRAYAAIGSALDLLGTDAPPFHRLKSLSIAQRIRPNESQGTQIRDLVNALGWDATPPE